MTVELTRLASVPVIQLNGALPQVALEDNSVDLVRQAARVCGGPAYLFYAPAILPDAATARALRQQPEVARAFARFGSITKAMVGIGLWTRTESTVYDATDEKERRLLRRRGVCADISGVLVDVSGQPVEARLTERMIGVSAAQMQAIPEVIAIAYNTVREPAIRAAIRGGLVNGLVTHTSLASALLASH
jgi:DNA-binding transcriptional regulator LsrR (DeoR family)